MSTQLQEANEMKIGDWESTPVVIKTGGGPVDPPNILCTINGTGEDFKSTLVDKKWQSAKSVRTLRVTGLEILVDGKPLPPIQADSSGLVVLQITYGTEMLIVQEVALPDSERMKLTISSSVPFAAGGGRDEWTDSAAEVPPDAPFLVFTQGLKTEKIQFESTAVEFRIMGDWDEPT